MKFVVFGLNKAELKRTLSDFDLKPTIMVAPFVTADFCSRDLNIPFDILKSVFGSLTSRTSQNLELMKAVFFNISCSYAQEQEDFTSIQNLQSL